MPKRLLCQPRGKATVETERPSSIPMSRGRTSRVLGIVLKMRNLGEADRIYTILTQERGKIDVLAKGVRRGRNLLSGRLEFMHESLLELHHGNKLDVITAADVQVNHFSLIVIPEAFATAAVAAEYLDSCCEREQPVPEVFELLRGLLQALAGPHDPVTMLPRFSLRLLSAIGVAPETAACVECGEILAPEPAYVFSIAEGGVLCGACQEQAGDALLLSSIDMENLRALARPLGSALPVTWRARHSVARLVERLMLHHLGPRPRARLAFEMLRSLPPRVAS